MNVDASMLERPEAMERPEALEPPEALQVLLEASSLLLRATSESESMAQILDLGE